jgi:hypothetical protein
VGFGRSGFLGIGGTLSDAKILDLDCELGRSTLSSDSAFCVVSGNKPGDNAMSSRLVSPRFGGLGGGFATKGGGLDETGTGLSGLLASILMSAWHCLQRSVTSLPASFRW